MESAQYLYMDINQLNGKFNWTMTYKQTSDFPNPYGMFYQTKPHPPPGPQLDALIAEFGRKNAHLARSGERAEARAAWFVSHCATQSRREVYVKQMQKLMPVDVYGKCGKFECSRTNETACYLEMERKYKFYLSFENSICDDYVTEKLFNIFRYDVVPLYYGGANLTALGMPPKAAINVMSFRSTKALVQHLKDLSENDAKYAEHFWWKDYYQIRNRAEDRAQAYCDLCKALNNPDEPEKVYDDMYKWWVSDSHCKRLRSSFFLKH